MRSFAFLVAAVALTGCAVDAAHPGDDESEDDLVGELSTKTDTFVSIRRDMRKCVSPMCGGYWVHEVNRKTADQYVSALEFTDADMGDAQDVDVILAGKLGKKEKTFGTRPLIVSAVYRALPGVTAAAGEVVYSAHDRDPAITCFTAPCNNEIGQKVNSTAKAFDFTRLSVDRAALAFVDKAWLEARVLRHEALVAAKIVNGAKFPGGYEKVLDASQVWIKVPDSIGPCMKILERICDDGLVATHARTPDRCMRQTECVKPAFCALYIPGCAPGYTLSSWRVAPGGCNAFACDPTFVVE